VDITVALQEIDYNIVSLKQMTAKRLIAEWGVTHASLPPHPSYARKESKSYKNLQIDNTM
jgi:hypothetical protein